MDRNDFFKLTEKRLFRYADHIAQIEELKDELSIMEATGDIKAQSYKQGGVFSHGIKNPVLDYVERVIKIEAKMARLENDTRPITRAIKDMERDKENALSRDFMILFKLFYCDKHDLQEIAAIIEKNRRTLYSRRRDFVKVIASYFSDS